MNAVNTLTRRAAAEGIGEGEVRKHMEKVFAKPPQSFYPPQRGGRMYRGMPVTALEISSAVCKSVGGDTWEIPGIDSLPINGKVEDLGKILDALPVGSVINSTTTSAYHGRGRIVSRHVKGGKGWVLAWHYSEESEKEEAEPRFCFNSVGCEIARRMGVETTPTFWDLFEATYQSRK